MLTATNESVADEARPVNFERESDIVLLKRIRQMTIDLRALCQRYSTNLAYEYSVPQAKVEQALMALLLRRELED